MPDESIQVKVYVLVTIHMFVTKSNNIEPYRFLYFIVSVSNPGIGNEVANSATS